MGHIFLIIAWLASFGASADAFDYRKYDTGAVTPQASLDFTAQAYKGACTAFSSCVTFTVGGSGSGAVRMMTDSTGRLTYAPNNLITYSNDWSNAAWTKNGATVTAGQADPVGGANATKIVFAGANNEAYNQLNSLGGTYLRSIWIKGTSGETIRLWGVNVTLNGSWQQYYTAGAISGTEYISVNTYSSVTARTVYVYAPTFSAVTYETTPRTADQVITTSSAYYGPRFDYDAVTLAAKGFAVWQSYTNSLLYSNAFTAAGWSSTVAPVQNVTGPDGVANSAWTQTAGAGGGVMQVYQTISPTNGAPYTFEVFYKPGTAPYVWLNCRTAATDLRLWVNTSTNQLATVSAGITASAPQQAANGFYRISGSVTSAGTSGFFSFGQSNADNTTNTTPGQTAVYYQGDFINLASAAPPVFTAASPVTVAADVAQLTGPALAALQGAQYSIIAEANTSQISTNFGVVQSSTTSSGGMNVNGGTAQLGLTNVANLISISSAVSVGVPFRMAAAFKASSYALSVSGSVVSTSANAASPASSGSFGLGMRDDGRQMNGWVRSLTLYTTRLPDAVLRSKSVVGASYYAANDNGVRFAFANDNLPVFWRIAL